VESIGLLAHALKNLAQRTGGAKALALEDGRTTACCLSFDAILAVIFPWRAGSYFAFCSDVGSGVKADLSMAAAGAIRLLSQRLFLFATFRLADRLHRLV
jgi:hypothetical protein